MSWLGSSHLLLLERYLDVVNMRQGLVATNIANVDTPGYHTRDIDFRGELARAMNGQPAGLTSPFVLAVPGLVSRPDGNNVSVDRESLLLAQIQLQFKSAVALIRAQFSQLSSAIKEGQP